MDSFKSKFKARQNEPKTIKLFLKKWPYSICGDSGDSGDWDVLQVYLDSIQNEPKTFKLILKEWSFSIYRDSGDNGDWTVLKVY